MGGLRKKLPVTFWTMTAGVFAIAGFFPFAGFFSKDAILYEAFQHGTLGKGLYFVGLVTALLTSFYMFRLWYLAFFGESRSEDPHYHPHESPWTMLTPLVLLALLSIAGGWVGIERFGNFLSPVTGPVIDPVLESGGKSLDIGLSVVAVFVALIGLLFAHLFYGSKNKRAENLAAAAPGVYGLLVKKYGIDELYSATVVQPLTLASRYILGWIGEGMIVRGSAWLLAGIATLLGEFLRRWQSGNLRSYSAWLAAGAAVVIVFAVAGAALGLHTLDFHILWAGR
jgi:NADH-quinone oxidoreductase subunit L